MTSPLQLALFDQETHSIDRSFAGIERTDLGRGAWIDFLPRWVGGSDALFRELHRTVAWQSYEMRMYDHIVEQPRLSARLDPSELRRWPILEEMAGAFEARYGEDLRSCWLNLYRDGRDSVAWHGDRHGRRQDQALVADVSLGFPRRFLMRPKSGGRSRRFLLGRGDLLVMGGTCQRTFEHTVPKVAEAGPRISITFRPWDAY